MVYRGRGASADLALPIGTLKDTLENPGQDHPLTAGESTPNQPPKVFAKCNLSILAFDCAIRKGGPGLPHKRGFTPTLVGAVGGPRVGSARTTVRALCRFEGRWLGEVGNVRCGIDQATEMLPAPGRPNLEKRKMRHRQPCSLLLLLAVSVAFFSYGMGPISMPLDLNSTACDFALRRKLSHVRTSIGDQHASARASARG